MTYKIKTREDSLATFKARLDRRIIDAANDQLAELEDVASAFNRALKGVLGVSCACGEDADEITEIVTSVATETLRVPVCAVCLAALRTADKVRSRLVSAAVGAPRGEEETTCPTVERSS